MISVYYDDNDGKLAMTHYCIMRNRPTHKAKIDKLKEWCKEERNFWKSKDYASGFNVAMGQTLLKLEELEG